MFGALVGLLLTGGAEPVGRVPTHRPWIALSFDACQDRRETGYDAAIVHTLRHDSAKATLFLGGAWVLSHAKEAKSLGADPLFEIGQHSFIHPHFRKLTAAQVRDDLSRAQVAVKAVTSRTPKLFRPPYGEWDMTTLAVAKGCGLTTVLWSIVTGDPDRHTSANSIVRTVLSRARPGDIVVMHMNGRGWHTAEALPRVIEGLRKKGFELVTVGELLAAR